MTNELAIRIITGDVLGTSEQTQEAITMAVKALSLPSAQLEKKIFEKMSDIEFEKWLYEHGICHPDIHDSIPCEVVPLLIDNAINELPSAQPEPQWIPCSERLPPLGEEVLVWAYERCYLLTLYAYPNDEGYYWSVEDYDVVDDEFDKIIAWMPLPEYKENTDD